MLRELAGISGARAVSGRLPLAPTKDFASALLGLVVLAAAALKGWQGWLELKRFELTHGGADHNLPPATGRIEPSTTRTLGMAPRYLS